MYKITNKMKDSRKFRDSNTGKDVVLGPKKSVVVVKPIDGGSVFKVEKINIEENEEKKINHKEVKQNDSSSS